MPKKFDLISIGDSTHDTFIELDEASLLCDIKPNKCLLCLSWADKIPAKKVTQVPGVGNSANAAVGSARLGLKTAIYTHIGDDVVGENILKVFKREKVAVDYVRQDKCCSSNYSVVLNYEAERTIIVHHQQWSYKLPKNLQAKWFYFSSIGPFHKSLHKQVVNCIKKNNIKLAFQPGTYQLREGRKKLMPILKHTDVILLNKEEAAALTQQEIIIKKSSSTKVTAGRQGTKKIVKDLISKLHKLGPKVVVVTDGKDGAYASDRKNIYFIDIFPLKAKERTGAGDSFSIGFVTALAKRLSIKHALLWGNANSTSVVQYIGAQKGLLDEKNIKRFIKRFRKIKSQII